MRKSSERVKVSALHEAGHVLVGHLLGYDIKRVTIFNLSTARKTGLDGRTLTSYNIYKTPLLHRGAVRLAGYAAEKICTRQEDTLVVEHCADDSLRLQEDWGSSHLSKKETIKLLDKSFKMAVNLIYEHWVAFMWLYEELRIGTVTHSRIVEIVDQYK